jgi:hypothetical protein
MPNQTEDEKPKSVWLFNVTTKDGYLLMVLLFSTDSDTSPDVEKVKTALIACGRLSNPLPHWCFNIKPKTSNTVLTSQITHFPNL